MKIAIASEGKNLDSEINQRGGRAHIILFFSAIATENKVFIKFN